jgi:hypothetical protein
VLLLPDQNVNSEESGTKTRDGRLPLISSLLAASLASGKSETTAPSSPLALFSAHVTSGRWMKRSKKWRNRKKREHFFPHPGAKITLSAARLLGLLPSVECKAREEGVTAVAVRPSVHPSVRPSVQVEDGCELESAVSPPPARPPGRTQYAPLSDSEQFPNAAREIDLLLFLPCDLDSHCKKTFLLFSMAQHVKNVSADKIALAVQKPICSSRARNLLICSVEKISHALLLSGMHELRTGLELCVAGRRPRAKAIILAFSDNDISAPWAKKVN